MFLKNEVKKLVSLLEVKEGMVVGDIGAGKGDFSVAFSKLVGNSGKVYAVEYDPERLKIIKSKIAKNNLVNVEVLQSTETETNIPQLSLDRGVIRLVYHHFSKPQEIILSIFSALKPGGKLAVIDFAPSFWFSLVSPVKNVPKNRGGHGIQKEILIEELTRAGFKLTNLKSKWSWSSYCLVFQKS